MRMSQGCSMAQSELALAIWDSDWYETVEKGRGRVETRRCRVVSDPAHIECLNEDGAWPKLASVAMVESERRVDRKNSRQTRYFISSLPGDAFRLLEAVRGHRGIENSVHWVLDVSFGEDESRVRRGNSAEIFAAMRRMALNMLKQEKSLKAGIAAKRKAGLDGIANISSRSSINKMRLPCARGASLLR